MPRFFHLHECGTLLEDEEGIELPDLAAARRAAVQSARDIMSGEIAAGRLCLGCRIEVRDTQGVTVLELPFREAVEISG